MSTIMVVVKLYVSDCEDSHDTDDTELIEGSILFIDALEFLNYLFFTSLDNDVNFVVIEDDHFEVSSRNLFRVLGIEQLKVHGIAPQNWQGYIYRFELVGDDGDHSFERLVQMTTVYAMATESDRRTDQVNERLRSLDA